MASSATAPNSLSFFSSSHQIPKTHISIAKSSSGKVSKSLSVVSQLATLPIISFEGDKIGETYLDLKTAPEETARSVVHRAIVTDLQNKRRGTASTLTRGEVRGGGIKPYAQKKTGNARRGSQRTPLRPGGGVRGVRAETERLVDQDQQKGEEAGDIDGDSECGEFGRRDCGGVREAENEGVFGSDEEVGVGSEGESDVLDGGCGGQRGEVEQEHRDVEDADAEDFESLVLTPAAVEFLNAKRRKQRTKMKMTWKGQRKLQNEQERSKWCKCSL
ncbi:hypothetical protein Rs2_22206 [Raphanus sativus]|nr:hypothetical protein Rs2_22206 [Raphanus sativus]